MPTLYDKLWQSHVVEEQPDGSTLIYVDRQLVHEVSSAQAFEGLRARGLGARRPLSHLAVADHAVPTHSRDQPIADPLARSQVSLLEANVREFGIPYLALEGDRHGIVHVVGPELGFTQPGITLVCGDSHTSTHGAFGTLAFGIGASECESVLATQTLRQRRARNLAVEISGGLPEGLTAKDMALALIARIGSSGAVGYAIEYRGEAVRRLDMAGRMTLCNMSIEAGSRTGLVAPDQTTFDWLLGRPMAPRGDDWAAALAYWRTLPSDPEAQFDRTIEIDASAQEPWVTWGTNPDQGCAISGKTPDPTLASSPSEAARIQRALDYMGLEAGRALTDIQVDRVFIGSCTNSRLEDLRAAAGLIRGRRVAGGVKAMVVPGSAAVKRQAEAEGLADLFRAAGFDWRDSGCSLCVAMNDDRLQPEERCASTSNRNFEGRQGVGVRTHLVSPLMAVSTALSGRLSDPRQFLG